MTVAKLAYYGFAAGAILCVEMVNSGKMRQTGIKASRLYHAGCGNSPFGTEAANRAKDYITAGTTNFTRQ